MNTHHIARVNSATFSHIRTTLFNASLGLTLAAILFFFLPTQDAHADITTGLIGHFKFDNTTTDSSGQGNNGTPVNGPTYTTGKINQAINFAGTDDHVKLTNFASQFPATAGSMSAWVRVSAVGSNAYVYTNKGSNGHDGSLYVTSAANRIRFTKNAVTSESTTVVQTNTWYHVVATWDSSGQRLYVNSVLEDSDGVGTIAPSGDGCIGSYECSSNFFPGQIDDVRIYNTALTAQNIQDLYDMGGSTPQPTVSISASNSTITAGNSSTLTWSTTNATSCSASASPSTSQWTDTKTTSGTQSVSPTVTTTYTLTCSGARGTGQNATTVTVTTSSDTTPPSTPTLNQPTAPSSSQVNLFWTAASDLQSGISGYHIYWCSGSSSCSPATLITVGNQTSYTHTGRPANTIHRYQVSAVNGVGLEGNRSTPVQQVTTQSSSSGTVYYVATTGDDLNPGTSQSEFKTIQKAANVVNPGDTVIVRDGVYSGSGNQLVNLTRSGTSGNPITFMSENKWGAILDGTGLNYRIINFGATGMGYVRIENFDMQNGPGNAIKFNSLDMHDLVIKGNHIHHNLGAGAIQGSSVDGLIIDSNYFHDNGDNCYGDPCEPNVNRDHAIYVGGPNVVVKNNVFARHEHGWAIQTSTGATNWKIVNNVFAFPNPSRAGHIQLYKDFTNSEITNNIFYDLTGEPIQYTSCNCSNINIHYNLTTASVMAESGLSASISSNFTSTNPFFVSPSTADFHLQSTSPAINTGATLSLVTTDFDGVTRPQGSGYDIGAYEYCSGGSCGGSTPIVGDLNQDGTVNSLDWQIMNSQWFTSNSQSDINSDGLVNSIDFGMMNKNWGKSS